MQLRLKFFDGVASPTCVYGLAVLPLSSLSLEKNVVVRRKMIRKHVGWARMQGEPWEVTMRRMKIRVDRALQ